MVFRLKLLVASTEAQSPDNILSISNIAEPNKSKTSLTLPVDASA
ncbi:hypothetical protein [Pantoea sp. Mhis]|nr:hypothetical protein [Pantoea sp. Mhis]